MEIAYGELAELMRLMEKATPGPWKKKLQSSYIIPICTALHNNYAQAKADAAYIVAACDAVPKMVERIMELEAQRDWLAQAAANAGWHGVRVSKEYMIEQSRMAGFVYGEPHECPTPEVSCHARDEQICMSDNHLACAQSVNQASFIMRRFTEVK